MELRSSLLIPLGLFVVLGQRLQDSPFTPSEAKAKALFRQVSVGSVEGVKRLLKEGVSPNALEPEAIRYGAGQVPPLCIAVGQHEYEIAALLLKAGANPNLQYKPRRSGGRTPLMIATGVNERRCVTLLLKYGADTTTRNENKETAYDMAVRLKRREIENILKKHKHR